ncbi:MAG TPA: nucleotidyltransferase domain-containing protein [Proteobacteria bacterium]|nr:nucleotidyltransferase domain-containing protein [Pseudomonadota bacterium]
MHRKFYKTRNKANRGYFYMAQVIDTDLISNISKFIDRLNKEAFRIDAIYLYGSYAKGEPHKWSDIDIAIVSQDVPEDNFDETVRLSVIASQIDSRIELVLFRPDDFIDENPLVWEIKKSGIPLEIEHGINH